MKQFAMIALLTLTAQITMAQHVPGGSFQHNLSCEGAAAGVGYSMTCTTQALPPEYSLRGCSLFSTVVVPNAIAQELQLEIVNQTATSASLINSYEKISVELNKSTMTAEVTLSNSDILNCNLTR